jgi:D-alanyl-lipoteichoic acid acyltransferase DltB (MBOAT superfamily)
MSYTIDIYRRKLNPTNDWIQFFAFVSFFPQLVAGPIERAANLLPQFETLKKPDYNRFRDGMLQIVWGFFKKLMIADRLAVFVDTSFGDISNAHDLPMLLGAFFFAFQLYCDFSAYSDIAIGTAKLYGLCLYSTRWKQKRTHPHDSECDYCIFCQRFMARRELEFRYLGHDKCTVYGLP